MSLIRRLGAVAALAVLTTGCTAPTTLPGAGAPSGSAAAPDAGESPDASATGLETPGTGDAQPTEAWPAAFPSAFETPSTGGIHLSATGQGRLDGKTIVVDPGHNKGWIKKINNVRRPMYGTVGARCVSVGATGADKKTPEHEVVFKIAEKLVPQLRAQGATVILTRPDDNGLGPCNDERAEMANRANADFLISIHADGAENQRLRGWYFITAGHSPGGQPLMDASRAAATKMIPGMQAKSKMPVTNYALKDGVPIKSEDLAVLNNLTKTRGVLIEIGNTVQTDDWAIMNSPEGQQGIADGLAEGVVAAVAG